MNFINLILLIVYLNFPIYSKLISIPFKVKHNQRRYLSYKTKTFLGEYYKNDIILELNIGNENNKYDCILNQDSSCFIFNKKDDKSRALINGFFSPKKSSSFRIDKSQINNDNKIVEDIFNFKSVEGKFDKYFINFMLQGNYDEVEINKNIYLPEIGIRSFKLKDTNSCPNFLFNLKSKNIINENILSIKYNISNETNKEDEGEILIGDDLDKYNLNYTKNYQYVKLYFQNKFSFEINSIYAQDKLNNNIINDNITKYYNFDKKREMILNINSGFIIGTLDFMNYIEEIFFKELIEKSICQKEQIKLENNNEKENENDNSEFYIFSCYELPLKGKDGRITYNNINYYEIFPKIIFSSHTLGTNFEFTSDDLFKLIFNKFYFLIIFKSDNISQNIDNDIWYFGQPFIKKYPTSINYDSKTIGFYLKKDNKTNIIEEKKIQIKEEKNNGKIKNVIICIGIILIVCIGLYIAYYIGLKEREKIRKRANEMKDDDYEYITEINKDINGNNEKNQKILEMNSKI